MDKLKKLTLIIMGSINMLVGVYIKDVCLTIVGAAIYIAAYKE